ncbi:MAG TPA: FkbM family methyltransferase, partial [Methanosarcina sp.]|nr:FkbM family methyltransferase [Methanosarcina sp.]
ALGGFSATHICVFDRFRFLEFSTSVKLKGQTLAQLVGSSLMAFISYAQNFEDITLWRAFRLALQTGFYIDVGANDPIIDSVTKAFYDIGWRGINIEPSPSYFQRLMQSRERDINLPVAASHENGEITFYDAGISGRSTIEADVALDLKNEGKLVTSRTVPARTLNSICEQYVSSEIHFLKIDVEGHELSVLQGLDLTRWRPWIILIENPFNVEPVWESLLTLADYEFVHYDGINRYYLCKEHVNLAGAFDTPPNILDDFQLCYGHSLSYPVAEMEAKIAAEKKRADEAENQLRALQSKLTSLSRAMIRELIWSVVKKLSHFKRSP